MPSFPPQPRLFLRRLPLRPPTLSTFATPTPNQLTHPRGESRRDTSSTAVAQPPTRRPHRTPTCIPIITPVPKAALKSTFVPGNTNPARISVRTRGFATHVTPRAVTATDTEGGVKMEVDVAVKRMSRERLAELLLQAAEAEATATAAVVPAEGNEEGRKEKKDESEKEGGKSKAMKVAVVDVRDTDHIGGHIRSSIHSPSSVFTVTLDTLLHTLKPYDAVIFHCALSQQRGPSAAIKYLRAKRALEQQRRLASSDEEEELLYGSVKGGKDAQEVYVLDGGFVRWQEKYGEDERLTESYDKELWSMGY
ncbi:hypothetical protein Dda_8840 [Drechslerella dactyloides]|uniref:Rhodanese domain-containing protein n=1 Tax=Drechslerella dactyloides TaxID=74499 RepID=A0AAD6NFN0_DREDA|nr:hypothetical protein Dda_8840 [Drechslerella dactyloides]